MEHFRRVRDAGTWIALMLIFALTLPSVGYSQDANAKERDAIKKPKVVVVPKTVSGTVSVIRPNTVNIVYGREIGPDGRITREEEIILPFDQSAVLTNAVSTADIGEGDRVEVSYDETIRTDENGEERSERKAKKIRFISKAKPKGALSSDEQL